jgi:hypothetical protein
MGTTNFGYLHYVGNRGGIFCALRFPLKLIGPIIFTYAGQPRQPGSLDGPVDGPRAIATLPDAWNIAFDPLGNLHFTSSDRLRMVAPDGTVTTTVYRPTPGADSYLRGIAGLAIDANGTRYVYDGDNYAVKKVSPQGEVTIWAGSRTGVQGYVDGIGTDARFSFLGWIAVASDGTAYVTDYVNATVRKISPAGVVTTLAGQPGQTGTADGTGSSARFSAPRSIAIDATGHIIVGDGGLRRISPDGVVTSLPLLETDGRPFRLPVVGFAIAPSGEIYFGASGRLWKRSIDGLVTYQAGSFGSTYGSIDGMGNRAVFNDELTSLAIDGAGNVFACDRYSIRRLEPNRLPTTPYIESTASFDPYPHLGGTAVLQITPGTAAPAIRWSKNGRVINEATDRMLVLRNLQAADEAVYSAELFTPRGKAQGVPVRISAQVLPRSEQGRLSNLAVRTFAGTGDQTLIVGFAIAGAASTAKSLLVRGLGPALATFSVPNYTPDPSLRIFRGAELTGANDDWGGDPAVSDAAASVGAFPLADRSSKDAAALLPQAPPSTYTVHVAGAGTGGVW